MRALFTRISRARAAAKNESGLAAVEFALLLPVMFTLFFGIVEVSLAMGARADVTNIASTGADLIAQDTTVSPSDMSNVWSAINAILYPYPTGTAKVTITSINYDTTSKSLVAGKVAWSCTKNGTARTVGSTVSLPAGLMTANGSVIMSEITYPYASPTSQIITGPLNMANTFYTKPRRVAQITGPIPANCPT